VHLVCLQTGEPDIWFSGTGEPFLRQNHFFAQENHFFAQFISSPNGVEKSAPQAIFFEKRGVLCLKNPLKTL
jgi:hypothetical protein